MPTSHYNLALSPEELIQQGQIPAEAPVVVAPAAANLEQQIIEGTLPEAIASEAVVEPVIAPSVVPAPVAPAVAVADEEVSDDPDLVKTAKGWEYRIDLGDGSGVQIFKGKTQKELLSALGKAQKNASKKIRQQNQERDEMIANQPAEVEEPTKRLTPRAPTAEEQWEIAQGLGDPAKAIKSLDRYMEIRLGGPIEQAVEKITAHDADLEYRRARNEAVAFMRENPDFYNTQGNNEKLATYIEEKGWASTKRNLQKAYAQLALEDQLEKRPEQVSTPESTTVSTEVVHEAVTAPVVSVPAPAAVATSTQPTPAATTQPAGLPAGARVRPGSSSTGLSPRESSVRQGGAQLAAPVGLTVEEYRRMPTSQTKLKYQRDPVFKAAVDKLISEGKI